MLCTVCRNDVPLTDFNFTEINAIDKVFFGRASVEKASALLFFTPNGIVQNLLHYLKYKNQQEIGTFLGNWFGEILKREDALPKIDLVVPVPLHAKKLKKRGYNQVDCFGSALAKHIDSEFLPNALVKTANTKTQTKKGRLMRQAHGKGLYQVTLPMVLQHKTILLVDDVITTGATLESCTNTIKEVAGTTVYVATMAAVPKLGN